MSGPNRTNWLSLFGWGYAGLVLVAIAATGDLTFVLATHGDSRYTHGNGNVRIRRGNFQ